MTNVHQPLSEIDAKVCHIYRNSTLSQKDIASILEIESWRVSDILIAHIPYAIRAARHKLTASNCQVIKRVPPPSWWEGPPGNSVPIHHVKFCEGAGLTYLPPGSAIVHKDNDKQNNEYANLMLVTEQVAGQIRDIRYKLYIAELQEKYSGV